MQYFGLIKTPLILSLAILHLGTLSAGEVANDPAEVLPDAVLQSIASFLSVEEYKDWRLTSRASCLALRPRKLVESITLQDLESDMFQQRIVNGIYRSQVKEVKLDINRPYHRSKKKKVSGEPADVGAVVLSQKATDNIIALLRSAKQLTIFSSRPDMKKEVTRSIALAGTLESKVRLENLRVQGLYNIEDISGLVTHLTAKNVQLESSNANNIHKMVGSLSKATEELTLKALDAQSAPIELTCLEGFFSDEFKSLKDGSKNFKKVRVQSEVQYPKSGSVVWKNVEIEAPFSSRAADEWLENFPWKGEVRGLKIIVTCDEILSLLQQIDARRDSPNILRISAEYLRSSTRNLVPFLAPADQLQLETIAWCMMNVKASGQNSSQKDFESLLNKLRTVQAKMQGKAVSAPLLLVPQLMARVNAREVSTLPADFAKKNPVSAVKKALADQFTASTPELYHAILAHTLLATRRGGGNFIYPEVESDASSTTPISEALDYANSNFHKLQHAEIWIKLLCQILDFAADYEIDHLRALFSPAVGLYQRFLAIGISGTPFIDPHPYQAWIDLAEKIAPHQLGILRAIVGKRLIEEKFQNFSKFKKGRDVPENAIYDLTAVFAACQVDEKMKWVEQFVNVWPKGNYSQHGMDYSSLVMTMIEFCNSLIVESRRGEDFFWAIPALEHLSKETEWDKAKSRVNTIFCSDPVRQRLGQTLQEVIAFTEKWSSEDSLRNAWKGKNPGRNALVRMTVLNWDALTFSQGDKIALLAVAFQNTKKNAFIYDELLGPEAKAAFLKADVGPGVIVDAAKRLAGDITPIRHRDEAVVHNIWEIGKLIHPYEWNEFRKVAEEAVQNYLDSIESKDVARRTNLVKIGAKEKDEQDKRHKWIQEAKAGGANYRFDQDQEEDESSENENLLSIDDLDRSVQEQLELADKRRKEFAEQQALADDLHRFYLEALPGIEEGSSKRVKVTASYQSDPSIIRNSTESKRMRWTKIHSYLRGTQFDDPDPLKEDGNAFVDILMQKLEGSSHWLTGKIADRAEEGSIQEILRKMIHQELKDALEGDLSDKERLAIERDYPDGIDVILEDGYEIYPRVQRLVAPGLGLALTYYTFDGEEMQVEYLISSTQALKINLLCPYPTQETFCLLEAKSDDQH